MTSLIEDLKKPHSLPDKTHSVSVVQTHISVVFVADAYVYKVKKPVNFGFLDFSSLEKRRHYCHQEVKLNNRLSKGIYMDVLPVRFDGRRHILGGTSGEVVEYAVKMRRIPDEKLMKSLFDKNALTIDHLQRIARVLARFHRATLRSPEIDRFGSIENFKVNSDENFAQVRKYVGMSIQKNEFEELKGWTEGFYEKNKEVFGRRIEQGRIRDCHGDLHMEHVCFTEELSVIDCIEFNDRFRYSDTIADIAFLLMDLEYHGGKDDATTLWNLYKEQAEEEEMDSLLTFYKVYRAFVRGKVNSFQADDEHISVEERQKAIQRAKKYFKLAYGYL